MNPEKEIEARVAAVFDMRSLKAIERRSGYPDSTLYEWKHHPCRIKAVDLLRLEEVTGERKRREA